MKYRTRVEWLIDGGEIFYGRNFPLISFCVVGSALLQLLVTNAVLTLQVFSVSTLALLATRLQPWVSDWLFVLWLMNSVECFMLFDCLLSESCYVVSLAVKIQSVLPWPKYFLSLCVPKFLLLSNSGLWADPRMALWRMCKIWLLFVFFILVNEQVSTAFSCVCFKSV